LVKIRVWCVTDLLALDGTTTYNWYRDEVQTSRMLFYLRVVPTCVSLIPVHTMQDKLASIMFLYPLTFIIIILHSILLFCLLIYYYLFVYQDFQYKKRYDP
jgi:hypothetical protein